MPILIEPISLLGDNFCYLLKSGSHVAIIDPGDAGPVVERLEQDRSGLETILLTHHHSDHCGGVKELKHRYGSQVAAGDRKRIHGLDLFLQDGDHISIGDTLLTALSVPGHTATHLAFHIDEPAVVFTGDTMFGAGCGRLFECAADVLFASLQKLAMLPESTMVYPGHDYTADNLEFAWSIEEGNMELMLRYKAAQRLLAANQPIPPATIDLEKRTNPFLRPFSSIIREKLGMETASDVAVFAELRKRKDDF